jgi:tagatose-1,6-bisphosphate aldolase non-catalytic subunit AgaZ/GatZ
LTADPETVGAAHNAAITAASEVRKNTPNFDLLITSVCNQVNQINSKISSFLNTLSTFNSGVEKIAAVCAVLCHMNFSHIFFDL